MMSHVTLIEDFGNPKQIEHGMWVRVTPDCNWRRSHNICRLKVWNVRPRLKRFECLSVDDSKGLKTIAFEEVEAIYRETVMPTTTVSLAAREYMLAKLDLREFEKNDPNNSARPWESLFYALDHAETRLMKELGL